MSKDSETVFSDLLVVLLFFRGAVSERDGTHARKPRCSMTTDKLSLVFSSRYGRCCSLGYVSPSPRLDGSSNGKKPSPLVARLSTLLGILVMVTLAYIVS
jgi:hypothetical protein